MSWNRLEAHAYTPPWFAGVRNWSRFHRKNKTQAVKVKGDPDRYLHAHARRRKQLQEKGT